MKRPTTQKEYRNDIRARFLEAMQEVIARGDLGIANDTDFGAYVGLQQQNITRMKKGGSWPTLDQVCRLCDVFGYAMDWVMRGHGDKHAKPPKTAVEKSLEKINAKLDKLLSGK